MDSTEINLSFQQMSGEFKQRMAYFEGELQKNLTQPQNVTSLAAEFLSFKTFMLNALQALQSQMELAARSIDALEMRGRRKILLLHGVPEEQKEVTSSVVVQVIVSKLKLSQFSKDDISRCHRMGRSSSDRPRPILVKFRDVIVRDKVWFAKTNLKTSGVTLSEFLTRARHEVFMAARQRFGLKNCWTREGNVYVLGSDGNRQRVNWLGDLYKIAGQALMSPKAATTESPRPMVASPKPVAVAKETAAPKSKRTVKK